MVLLQSLSLTLCVIMLCDNVEVAAHTISPPSLPSSYTVTISAHGDSLTSCNGVTPSQSFALLSYRESLWKDHIAPWVAAHSAHTDNSNAQHHPFDTSAPPPPQVSMIGRKRGCNRILDARFDRSLAFPNWHDAYFGRSAAKMLLDWHGFVDSATQRVQAAEAATSNLNLNRGGGAALTGRGREEPEDDIVVGNIVLLLIGTNDFLLFGRANVSEVAHNIGQLAQLMLARCGEHVRHVLVGMPPDLDAKRAKLSWNRAVRWKEYLSLLRAGLVSLTSRNKHELFPYCWKGEVNRCKLVEFTGWEPAQHTYDGIHPNPAGEKLIAKSWASELLPILDAEVAANEQLVARYHEALREARRPTPPPLVDFMSVPPRETDDNFTSLYVMVLGTILAAYFGRKWYRRRARK